jgi:protein SCO1/2
MLVAVVASALVAGGSISADEARPKANEKQLMQVSQEALGRTVGSHAFVGARGEIVGLDDFRGKPLIISLIYTACDHVCPLITQSLAQAVEAADGAFGGGAFHVVTIGFDVRNDTPDRMSAYAKSQGVSHSHWRFLSGDKRTVESLSADIGFVFYESPRGFDHLMQTTIVDPEGRVYRQIYGENFRAPMLVEPLKQLIFGRRVDLLAPVTWLDRIRLLCTVYDPLSDKYRFSYAIFIGLAIGVASLGGVAAFLVRSWWRMRTRRVA